jgi:hypothetical protein
MSDVNLSEFEALSRPKKRLCPLAGALDALPADESGQLAAALREDVRVITTSAIITWLGRRGHQANVSAVTSHRRGTCSCADDA